MCWAPRPKVSNDNALYQDTHMVILHDPTKARYDAELERLEKFNEEFLPQVWKYCEKLMLVSGSALTLSVTVFIVPVVSANRTFHWFSVLEVAWSVLLLSLLCATACPHALGLSQWWGAYRCERTALRERYEAANQPMDLTVLNEEIGTSTLKERLYSRVYNVTLVMGQCGLILGLILLILFVALNLPSRSPTEYRGIEFWY